MRLSKPRLAPLEESDLNEEKKEVLQRAAPGGSVPNIFKTLVRHHKLFKRWLVFASHILSKNSLPQKEREMAILRIGYLCKSGYEWSQHVVIGKRCGLTDEDIDRLRKGPDADGWSESGRAVVQATDELYEDTFISDQTWETLQANFSEHQIMDLVFTVGNYNLVSMALNTFGVQLEQETPETGLDI